MSKTPKSGSQTPTKRSRNKKISVITSNPFLNYFLSICKTKGSVKLAMLAKRAGDNWRNMNYMDKTPYYILANEAKRKKVEQCKNLGIVPNYRDFDRYEEVEKQVIQVLKEPTRSKSADSIDNFKDQENSKKSEEDRDDLCENKNEKKLSKSQSDNTVIQEPSTSEDCNQKNENEPGLKDDITDETHDLESKDGSNTSNRRKRKNERSCSFSSDISDRVSNVVGEYGSDSDTDTGFSDYTCPQCRCKNCMKNSRSRNCSKQRRKSSKYAEASDQSSNESLTSFAHPNNFAEDLY